MRNGPDMQLTSNEILRIWKKVKAGGGKHGEFRICRYCNGAGQKTDRLENKKTQGCKHCNSYGFVRMGNATAPGEKLKTDDIVIK